MESSNIGETSMTKQLEEEKHEVQNFVLYVIEKCDLPGKNSALSPEESFKSFWEAQDSSSHDDPKHSKPRIQRVPKMLLDKDNGKKDFEPKKVSIGPYHHENDNLREGETIKLQWAKKITNHNSETAKKAYLSVLKKIKIFMACYDEEIVQSYDDRTLAFMLFVDGCLVLCFLCLGNIISYEKFSTNDQRELISLQQDFLLMENQVPYEVLQLLTDQLIIIPRLWYVGHADWFITKCLKSVLHNKGPFKPRQGLLCLRWLRKFKPVYGGGWLMTKPNDRDNNPSHLLELIWKLYVGLPKQDEVMVITLYYHWRSFHSVTELTTKGILLKPSESITDIAFNDHLLSPVLKLPPITIDDTTKTKLLNLVALEMSDSISDHNNEVTSYICLLDSLINHPDDIKELREAGILINCHGSNEELATFFKELANYGLVPSTDGIYGDVLWKIEKHLKSRRKSTVGSWIAEVNHSYFRSPWTAIAVAAGFLAIFVSIVQTYYTIFPPLDKCNESICKYIGSHI